MNEALIKQIVSQVVEGCTQVKESKRYEQVEVEASGRHVHLSQAHIDELFGQGYKPLKLRDISQPGQYICKERISLIGPSGEIKNVALLGPPRNDTQVEISMTDSRVLGIEAPLKMSGDLEGAADIYLMQGKKIVFAKNSVIVAQNHLHLTCEDAESLEIKDGQIVAAYMKTKRPLIFDYVVARVSKNSKTAMHIDFDEANACCFQAGEKAIIVVPFNLKKDQLATKGVIQKNKPTNNEEKKAVITDTKNTRILSAELVQSYAKRGEKSISIRKNTKITPLARDVIKDNQMEILYV